ncbi:MAG: universal stress protein [Chloroflexi bacterium]|nr:universal stress protein [Chloroflexota bacterium]
MYRRILVTLDGTRLAERVLDYARVLAKSMNVPITLLRVVRHIPHMGAELNPTRHVHHTLSYRMDQAGKYLSRLAVSLESDGIEVERLVKEGTPGAVIIDQANLVPDTLVAMSTHSRYGLPRLWFGSVTDEVLRKTEIPMLIVGSHVVWDPGTEPKLERAIVALDGSTFAEKALPHAVAIAKALGLKIVLAKVTPSEGLFYYEGGEDEPEEEVIPEGVDSNAKRYLRNVERGLRKLKVRSIRKEVLHSLEPSTALSEYAANGGSSLLAVATHARSGLARGLIGSVADRLLQESPHPLLVLHVVHHGAEEEEQEKAKPEPAGAPR